MQGGLFKIQSATGDVPKFVDLLKFTVRLPPPAIACKLQNWLHHNLNFEQSSSSTM